jgi:hypothetical protein
MLGPTKGAGQGDVGADLLTHPPQTAAALNGLVRRKLIRAWLTSLCS